VIIIIVVSIILLSLFCHYHLNIIIKNTLHQKIDKYFHSKIGTVISTSICKKTKELYTLDSNYNIKVHDSKRGRLLRNFNFNIFNLIDDDKICRYKIFFARNKIFLWKNNYIVIID